MLKKRKTKFVVWLHNRTDSRDDEWKAVWAHDKKEALKAVTYDSRRFSIGRVYTAKDFKRFHGLSG